MSEFVSYIPFDKIDKIKIYVNTSKYTIYEIVKKEAPDYAITGVFYNTQWKPTCQLKADGTVLVSDKYTYYGYRWNSPDDFAMDLVPTNASNYDNFIACCQLVVNGNKTTPIYNSDVGGTRGRTGIGIKGDKLVLYASNDNSTDAKTPEKLRDYVYDTLGIKDAFIMFDGGGKVNYYGDGKYLSGGSKSQNLILVYLKKDNTEDKGEENTSVNNNYSITTKYITNNPRYTSQTKKTKTGYMQHSTGSPGAMATSIYNSFNSTSAGAETEFCIDDTGIYQFLPLGIRAWSCGGSGNNTHIACEICEPQDTRFLDANWATLSKNGKNNTTFAVKAVQNELVARGYDTNGVDGIFGSGTETAVKSFQKAKGLSVDGMVGKNTLHALQDREGSYVAYDVEANQDYFENVYNKAVWLCAYVLNKIGVYMITSTNVCSHAEGYELGIASNHADCDHFFAPHGKTMDDFRQDVKNYYWYGTLPFGGEKEEETPVEPTTPSNDNEEETNTNIEQASSWAQESWIKACNKGVFDGTDPGGILSREQCAVVIDRLGLLD